MRIPAKATYSLLVLLIMATIGWWFLRSRQPVQIQTATERSKGTLQMPPTKEVPASGLKPAIIQPFARTPYLGPSDPRWADRRRLRKEDPTYEWRTPIEFYGKIVDEEGQPVEGAMAEVSWVGTHEKYGNGGVGKRSLLSDANGLFNLTGVEGKCIDVYVSKDGYYRQSFPNGKFEYAGFWEPVFIEPDQKNPVVFHLVKRPAAEPTYHIGERLLLPPPSWIAHLDLLAKPAKTASGGDVTLRIIRPSHPGYANPFDWELRVEGNNGAEIVESTEEFLLRAPEKGYENTVTKDYKKVRGNSIETVRFYVRNKQRKLYAAVSLEVTAYYPNSITKEDTSCIIIEATVNPNDSPNLEYDPKKDIRELARRGLKP